MKLSKRIDYSLLIPDATDAQIKKLCSSAKKFDVGAVCVNPHYVKLCKKLLKKIGVVSVVGYPLGQNLTETKVFEAQKCFRDGADEIDIVMNIGAFKSGKYGFVLKELKEVVNVAKKFRKKSKVIIEASILSDSGIKKASLLALKAGADFVKTGTGHAGPATAGQVRLIKSAVKGKCGIKASGGISTRAKALSLIKTGASRIGASNAKAILS